MTSDVLQRVKRSRLGAALVSMLVLLAAVGGWTQAGGSATQPVDDVIARVGDQDIRFSEINAMLNSSAVVGVSIPSVGTKERDRVRIMLLDKFVSANLLYLDARKQGLDQDTGYREDLRKFADGTLGALYRQRETAGAIQVTDDELKAFAKEHLVAGTELTDELRPGIEAMLRREKYKARVAEAGRALREGIEVRIHETAIDPDGDGERKDEVPVAEFGDQTIRWGDVKAQLQAADQGATMIDPLAMERNARRAALEDEINLRLMARKARSMGLDRDPIYLTRYNEYAKTRLINLQRERLVTKFKPDEKALAAYYEANRDEIVQPEARKVQMVVVKTKEEADALKQRIEKGELTMYQAAQQQSLAPTAQQDLGEIGWVNQGEALPALDKAIFDLAPGAVGGPVETPAGWHLVTVQDMRDAQYDDFGAEKTRQLVLRRYLHKKLDDYTVDLRKNAFEVKVYEDVLLALAQQEADEVKRLTEQSAEPGSVTQQRLKEMEGLIKKP